MLLLLVITIIYCNSIMLTKIFGLLHLCFIIFMVFYIFIIPKNFIFDFIFVSLNILQVVVWIYHDNLCPITYYYSKYYNKSSKSIKNNSDLNEIIDINNPLSKIVQIIGYFIGYISIYYASIRSNIISPILTLLFIFSRILYKIFNSMIDIKLQDIGYALFGKSFSKIDNLYTYSGFHKKIKPYFNNGILGIHVCLLIYIFYHNKTRLYSNGYNL